MVTLITITIPSLLSPPTIGNTAKQILTVKYIKRFNSVATYIGVEEYSSELVVYNDLVTDSIALSSLSAGDEILVREYTKISGGRVWAMSINDVDIVRLDDSFKFVEKDKKKLLQVGIGFSCFFAVTTIVCFCGYKGVFSKHKA